jgi:hypothetical protein
MQLVMLSGAVRLGGLYFRKDLVNIYGMLRHISRSSPLACFIGATVRALVFAQKYKY